ncbi:MAG TPA: transglycosylase family protein [Thermoleophilaceae bacterium]|nr:transglycosylase family protein [Thermoleophilaceae bacterium]
MKTQVTILLALACALVPAAAVATALAQEEPQPLDTTTTSQPDPSEAVAASDRLHRAYQRWRRKLERFGVWRGRNLVVAARVQERPATTFELRRSIHRMQKRFQSFLRTPEGRAALFSFKVERIPDWGRQHLRSIAWCESKNNPRAIGGGGAYRGMYQFSFSTWGVVGGTGDPAAAPKSEQTWRAWLLLSRHGAGHWPVCG